MAQYTFRKKQDLFSLLKEMKLWPSRSGLLHGIKSIDTLGNYARLTLYCGQEITVKNSKNSRAARWLRNTMMIEPCTECEVPDWKIEKYSNTTFK
ncbi:pyrrolysine--tRNA(Pyl) ligase small subunit [Acetohalobium arabaticum]|uniref:Uncharacterized protein n=1 Tax=Acetohalobium arabaticum (strain ATCC 49924 / DSM 5501 / Z-7288) TaxID=574087 RepID=D9QUA9_ACEAZ|nr:pyrrolysine--tRNA(Pyl) ligase small subunit [Acetohalobium arabaticum]ADL11902.1 conserved hypothetical protein [Acetohalobium arabaticum DSM 5501]